MITCTNHVWRIKCTYNCIIQVKNVIINQNKKYFILSMKINVLISLESHSHEETAIHFISIYFNCLQDQTVAVSEMLGAVIFAYRLQATSANAYVLMDSLWQRTTRAVQQVRDTTLAIWFCLILFSKQRLKLRDLLARIYACNDKW